MFYAVAPTATTGDRTVFQVLNSMPPPVTVLPSEEMTQSTASTLPVVNGVTQIVPAGITGTLQGFEFSLEANTQGSGLLGLQDGLNRLLWVRGFTLVVNTSGASALSGLRLRFYNGLVLAISQSSWTALQAAAAYNVYYSVP
jgi:hypothetical protein